MNDICFPPNFSEQYLIPYLTELLEAEIENADEIYEFSVHYFQDKVKEKEGSGHVPKNKVASENISDVGRMNCIAPIFCYDSVSKSFPKDSKLLHELEDDQNKNISSKIASTPNFENESDFEQNSEHLCRHGIIRQNEPETLQQINEFSFLLSKCIPVIDLMENIIRATTASLITREKPAEVPREKPANPVADAIQDHKNMNDVFQNPMEDLDCGTLKILSINQMDENLPVRWIMKDLFQNETEENLKGYGTQEDLANPVTDNIQDHKSVNDVFQKPMENFPDCGTPKILLTKEIKENCGTLNDFFQKEIVENKIRVGTRKDLTNPLADDIQECENVSDVFIDPTEEDLDCGVRKVLSASQVEENPDSEAANSSCKRSLDENFDFITSLDIFQNLIRENIQNSQFLRCLFQNHITPEVINHEVKTKSPKLKYKTATERLKEQLEHLIAVNNTLRHSCQGEETAGSNGSEPNIAPKNKNVVPMTGRNWLRTYCTVQAMKGIKEEDWRALYGAGSQAHDLGTPVWILQTNATSPCKKFKSGGFFNGFRAWYFAWGIRAVEEKLHVENSPKEYIALNCMKEP